jgi:murein DD-endopeptidase MepM/ murein hydrolase activator NlpD
MQLDRNASFKTTGIFVASIIFLQSCATFRSHIDTSCVDRFATEYPDPQDSRFVLPWRAGESFKLTQGNCTFESHSLSEKQHMSFDFKMPKGTPIVAVDDGRVFVVVEQFKDGIDDGFEQANLVGIEHEGGFLSWYMHLTFEGSLVSVDDQVLQGDVIAFSGNTGRSAYPHLHFFVQQLNEDCHDAESRTADLQLCPQAPVSFSNVSPSQAVLQEWVTYTAM